ncbi:trypsin-1-like isoform X2 [Homarus americanus]|uniref:trypsin-1-like isoform X2 n=1 Tax=Homarus americanus TaxID=6706 RepID=UPI001C465B2D|nr:trypsin-1-like isoform X2 [Homarus americanus]
MTWKSRWRPASGLVDVLLVWAVMGIGGVTCGVTQERRPPCILPKMGCDPHKALMYQDSDSIIGGEVAEPGSTPWLISLQDTQYFQPVHFCGATLLTHTWLLTSAGCVQGYQYPFNTLQVVAGEYDLAVFEGWERWCGVNSIHLHPDYNYLTHDYDVALVEMSSKVKFNDRIQPLPLPNKSRYCQQNIPFYHHSHADDLFLISGWGRTAEVSEISNLVLQAYVPKIPRQQCCEAYQDLITDSMVCAGNFTHGGLDPCQGDWGGALVSNDGFIAGVSSWSIGCGRPGFPAVFINTESIVSWICHVTAPKPPVKSQQETDDPQEQLQEPRLDNTDTEHSEELLVDENSQQTTSTLQRD